MRHFIEAWRGRRLILYVESSAEYEIRLRRAYVRLASEGFTVNRGVRGSGFAEDVVAVSFTPPLDLCAAAPFLENPVEWVCHA